MTKHDKALIGKVQACRRGFLDGYGATNRAEFFAIAAKAFFEKLDTVRRKLPGLYKMVCDDDRQNPENWRQPDRGTQFNHPTIVLIQ